MFENLSDRLDSVFKKLKGHGTLNENNIEDGLKQVRMALLEADVNYKVAKSVISDIKTRALGQEVMQSLTPGQQIIKIVNDEFTKMMGSEHQGLNLEGKSQSSVMLIGLQGSGKTTTAGKLALYLRNEGRKPFLVPVDVYRPAAIDQLKKIGKQLDIPVFQSTTDMKPLKICQDAQLAARQQGCDTLILDTAGRLHLDEELMEELKDIKRGLNPSEILLVADAMTGQDAVNIASSFDTAMDISGVILTKMDGDARGGAALSIKAVTGKPLKFVGVGEKSTALEAFHPDRMASRILGMGDTLSFIEKATQAVDQKEAKELEKKLRKNTFTLEDFKNQMRSVRKMGSIKDLIGMLPGVNKKALKGLNIGDKEFGKIEAIINSMTPEERRTHAIIKGSRKKRIANGSGVTVQDVNNLLKSYTQSMKMIKKFNKGGMSSLKNMLPF
ncbi:MAG: signal recognition particle protein [Proteobacteria bacterium]|nr:signal recognition particle protein [Pseudomonadota bacterium]MBU1389307.1 signal recognition particle protein [Pseudomonadota bacterium]MBU1544127.1 signal recognition particle protein [Pseudomonadota bacterium]MBU2430428.1 signal recognition particle protein [Pseudomonadota bacterium]MBU2482736.1 signal recognition particle protein [Pseudomonadota bacterium]